MYSKKLKYTFVFKSKVKFFMFIYNQKTVSTDVFD